MFVASCQLSMPLDHKFYHWSSWDVHEMIDMENSIEMKSLFYVMDILMHKTPLLNIYNVCNT